MLIEGGVRFTVLWDSIMRVLCIYDEERMGKCVQVRILDEIVFENCALPLRGIRFKMKCGQY